MADVRLTATNPADSKVVPVACNAKGELKLEEIPDQSFDGNLNGNLVVSGTSTFDRDVQFGDTPLEDLFGNSDDTKTGAYILSDGAFVCARKNDTALLLNQKGNPSAAVAYLVRLQQEGVDTTVLGADGSVNFAGNKAGFTKEGYLWCTTERGDTVILQATSNGMGIWEPYSPSRRDKLEEWAEKNALRPKPEESSRD